MSLKGILGGIDVDVIPEQYSTDQSPPGLLGTYKRLDGIKDCEYSTSSWHWVNSIIYFLKKNLNAPRPSEHPPVRGGKCQNVKVGSIIAENTKPLGTQGTDRGNIFVYNLYKCTVQYSTQLIEVVNTYQV